MAETGVEAEFALEEPSLRYHRLENDLPGSLAKTEITTVAAHWKFIVLGHKDGTVNIFDHLGNLIQNGSYKKHFRPINQISISDDDNFVASCADDGFVGSFLELINLSRPVKAMAISPIYSKTRKLITGGKSVTLHSRGAFGRRTSDQLYVPPGGVQTMAWRGNVLIWADDAAVRVYSVRRRQLINYIPKFPNNLDNVLEGSLRCHLTWYSDSCFLIGWEKIVQVCQILRPSSPAHEAIWSSTASNDDNESIASSHYSASIVSGPAQPKEYVQIATQLDLGRGEDRGVICGIATHQNRILVLLYPLKSVESLLVVGPGGERSPQLLVADVGDALTNPSCPLSELDLMFPVEDAFEEISLEDVELRIPPEHGFQGLGLATIPGEDTHFVYSPVDMVYAQALSADDRIDWFLEQDMPRRALQIANEYHMDLVRHSPKKLGMDYLNKLIEDKKYQNAAGLCKLLLTDKESWEVQIYRFLQLGQLHVLVPYLPSTRDLIGSSTYEVILIDLLSKSPQMLLQKLKEWPPNSGLYSPGPIIAAIQGQISLFSTQGDSKDPDMNALWRALIILYENAGEPEQALEISIRLKDSRTFDFLRRHLLPEGRASSRFGAVVRKQLIPLCQIDITRAVLLMIDCMRELPVDFVVEELDSQPLLLFKYLDALNARNPRSALPHVYRLVKLYASYSRQQLLPFLRSTHHYPLNEALTLCQSLNYVPETIYLLTRVGRRKDALRLLMEKGAEDPFLLGSKTLTMEQRQAEVAARAIAYCLEEDSSQRGTYLTSYDQPHRLHSKLVQKRSRVDSGGDPGAADCASVGDNSGGDSGNDDGDYWTGADGGVGEGCGELWKQVVFFAVDKPGFICALLNQASTERIDPSLLLRKIAPNTVIPHLKESLVNLLRNTQMQIELRRNCENILLKDLHEVSSRLVSMQNRGVFVDIRKEKGEWGGSAICRVCRQTLLSSSTERRSSSDQETSGPHQPPLLVFRCSHVFHQACLLRLGRFVTCPVCVREQMEAA
uniref:Vacuolar protein sorting associated protein 41 n=1 Tax=Echinococcus granulosus TaxID=6210 RepID=A0A068WVK8_ECHGR|nr:vacuolar protein sorting associated protein 41 [Echinococcus granulosus]